MCTRISGALATAQKAKRGKVHIHRSTLRLNRPESVNRTANAARPDRSTGTINNQMTHRPFVSTSVAVCRAASVSAPPGIVGATETPRYTGPKASQRPAHQARASAVHTDITVTPMRFANAFQCLLTLAVMHFAFYSC